MDKKNILKGFQFPLLIHILNLQIYIVFYVLHFLHIYVIYMLERSFTEVLTSKVTLFNI